MDTVLQEVSWNQGAARKISLTEKNDLLQAKKENIKLNSFSGDSILLCAF